MNKILHKITGVVLLEKGTLSDADLSGADLHDANLSYADLRGANLSYADLRGADLHDANLSYANLRGAYLSDADLSDADLRGADLSYADLSDADLRDANLSGANLRDAVINWQSHQLVSELLFRDAGDSTQRRMVAGVVRISLDWCWYDFLKIKHREREWALDTLAKYARDGDGAPDVLRNRVVK